MVEQNSRSSPPCFPLAKTPTSAELGLENLCALLLLLHGILGVEAFGCIYFLFAALFRDYMSQCFHLLLYHQCPDCCWEKIGKSKRREGGIAHMTSLLAEGNIT